MTDSIISRLQELLIDPVIMTPDDCKGLKQIHVMGDFDLGTVSGHVDGNAECVLRMLEGLQ